MQPTQGSYNFIEMSLRQKRENDAMRRGVPQHHSRPGDAL